MKKIILLALLFSVSTFAKEGGNGGGVIICPQSIELYDFWEYKDIHYPSLLWKSDPKLSHEDYLDAALRHIKKDIPEVHDLVAKTLTHILSTPKDKLFVDVSIPKIDDATIRVFDESCRYEQAANWNERFKKLFISRSLFHKLDGLNQAGLIMHEAIYKLSRDTFVATETSDKVRHVVAKIFSDERLEKADAEVILSTAAQDEATRPYCLETKKSILDIEKLLAKYDDQETRSLHRDSVELCLKICKVRDLRSFCEDRL